MGEGKTVAPLDIQQKRFPVSFRGYDRTEVEMFLDRVRDEMESLVRELAELREFRRSHDQRMRELNEKEETVRNTMQMTQQLIEELKEGARKEAALIMKDAEIRRQQIIGSSQTEKIKLEGEIQELKRRKHHFLLDIKKVIDMHREMIAFEEAGEKTHGTPAE